MTQTPIGKYARVPAVLVKAYYGFAGWIPVIGPKHEDAEIIKFPHQHFHIDWRYAPTHLAKLGINSVYSMVISCPDNYGRRVVFQGPELRRIKCKRDWPEFPYYKAKWLPELNAAMRGKCLKTGMVCPHRGLPLSGAPVVDGVVTCVGHGLRWNVATGELVE